MTKLTYHGLKTQRSTVESTLPLAASKIEGATKSSNWEEKKVNEVIGMDDITFTSTSINQDASRDSYWKTDF